MIGTIFKMTLLKVHLSSTKDVYLDFYLLKGKDENNYRSFGYAAGKWLRK